MTEDGGWMALLIQWTWHWTNSGRYGGQGSLVCCSPGVAESDTTEWNNKKSITRENRKIHTDVEIKKLNNHQCIEKKILEWQLIGYSKSCFLEGIL